MIPPLEIEAEALRRGLGDPAAYACMQWSSLQSEEHGPLLDNFQLDILRSAFDSSVTEIRIKGCAKAGKGTATALVANIWFRVFAQCRIIVNSSSYSHARQNLFGEILMWRRQMLDPGPGENHKTSITDHERHEMTVVNPETGEGFSGQHTAHTLVLFDEATGVPNEFYDFALNQAALIICLANPRTTSGWFYDGFPKANPDRTQTLATNFGNRRLITVSGASLRNVRERRLELPVAPVGGIEINKTRYREGTKIPTAVHKTIQPVIPRQLDYGRYKALKKKEPWYARIFADGRFPEEDPEYQVILPSWLERHTRAHTEIMFPEPGEQSQENGEPAEDTKEEVRGIRVTAFGFDVCRSEGGDQNVLSSGSDEGCREQIKWHDADTTRAVDHVLHVTQSRYGIDLTKGTHTLVCDADGLGGPVADLLRRKGVKVIDNNGNEKSQDFDRTYYFNRRAANFGHLGERLNPDGNFEDPWPIPDDAALLEELVVHQKVYTMYPQFKITPKHPSSAKKDEISIEQMLGRSPDSADSLVYLYRAVQESHRNDVHYMGPPKDYTPNPSRFLRRGRRIRR